jgi:hypothetical protein
MGGVRSFKRALNENLVDKCPKRKLKLRMPLTCDSEAQESFSSSSVNALISLSNVGEGILGCILLLGSDKRATTVQVNSAIVLI